MSKTKNLKIFQKVSLTALLLGSFVLVGTGCGKKKTSDDISDIIAQEYDDYARKNQDKINQPIPTGTTDHRQNVIEPSEPTEENTNSRRSDTSPSSGNSSSRKSLLDEDRERSKNTEYHSLLEKDAEQTRKAEEERKRKENQVTPTPTVQEKQEGNSYTKKY